MRISNLAQPGLKPVLFSLYETLRTTRPCIYQVSHSEDPQHLWVKWSGGDPITCNT
ncbi:UNVERIFIED_CONTAM: hypothetical protein FKN15_005637 [Acipenser sinensis]